MTVSGSPPFSWGFGTDLTAHFMWSRVLCEAMQALKNRADYVDVSISDWSAYDAEGYFLQNLGQTPNDIDLKTYEAWRHVNHIEDLRVALGIVCVKYYDAGEDAYTIETLLTEAVGRDDWNRSSLELQDLGYFDGEDVEEILKAIDLLAVDTIEVEVDVYIDHDAKVETIHRDVNYNAKCLEVGVDADTVEWLSWVRLNTASIPTDPITACKLRMYCTGLENPLQPIDIAFYRSSDGVESWDEETITFNNMPGITVGALSTQRITGAGWYEWDVDDYVFYVDRGLRLMQAGVGGHASFYDFESVIKAFTCYNNSGDATTATIEVTDSEIILIQTGGVGDGTNTFEFVDVAYDTMSELIAVIEALDNWTATIANAQAADSTDLLVSIEPVSAKGIGEEQTLKMNIEDAADKKPFFRFTVEQGL